MNTNDYNLIKQISTSKKTKSEIWTIFKRNLVIFALFQEIFTNFSHFSKKYTQNFCPRANFSLRVCLAVCLIFQWFSAWRAYKLRAYKKNVYSKLRKLAVQGPHMVSNSIALLPLYDWMIFFANWFFTFINHFFCFIADEVLYRSARIRRCGGTKTGA